PSVPGKPVRSAARSPAPAPAWSCSAPGSASSVAPLQVFTCRLQTLDVRDRPKDSVETDFFFRESFRPPNPSQPRGPAAKRVPTPPAPVAAIFDQERTMQETMRGMSEKAAKIWVLALTSVASFMVALDALVVTTALSTIRLDLGASIEALEWTVNAYNLSFAVLLLTGAALGDRFGRRRMFAAGLGLFVVASIACALASNVGWLIAARTVQGAGAALVMPLAM